MRIIIVVHGARRLSGIPKYSFLLARELAALGESVRLVVDSAAGGERAREVCHGKVPVDVVGPECSSSLDTLFFAWNLSNYLQHQDFDVLQASHVTPFFYLRSGRRHPHRPVVFHPFGNELFSLAGHGLSRIRCLLTRPVLQSCGHRADRLLMEGEFQREDMARWYRNEKQMRVLPVGIDTLFVSKKGRYATGRTSVKFLTVNSLYPYEGMETLIDQFQAAWLSNRVFCPDREMELAIVGSGPLERKLKERAKVLPIKFYKEISDEQLDELRVASDFYVSVTLESDVQMGVLEAMAAGLPVISTGRGWVPDSVVKCTAKELGNTLLKMSRLPVAEREALGKAGQQEVQEYDMRKIAQQAVEIYKELV